MHVWQTHIDQLLKKKNKQKTIDIDELISDKTLFSTLILKSMLTTRQNLGRCVLHKIFSVSKVEPIISWKRFNTYWIS